MRKLLLIPAMLCPYSFIFAFLLSECFSGNISESISAYLIIFSFIAAFVCNGIFVLLSRKADAYDLIAAALLVKIVHIPSYLFVFALGAIASIMLFMTFPLILMLILYDCVILFFSSSISVFALAKNIKNSAAFSIIALVCQFFFCTDIISLFVLYRISKNHK